MSAMTRDETRSFRHVTPGCILCGEAVRRASTGRRRLYCGPACRQHAYRFRDEARRRRGARAQAADPREVTRLLGTVLQIPTRR